MNDRSMLVIMAAILLAFGIYVLGHAREVKAANRSGRFAFAGWGERPIWFFRLVGVLCLVGSAAFVVVALTRH